MFYAASISTQSNNLRNCCVAQYQLTLHLVAKFQGNQLVWVVGLRPSMEKGSFDSPDRHRKRYKARSVAWHELSDLSLKLMGLYPFTHKEPPLYLSEP
jgi:hypothetical protein